MPKLHVYKNEKETCEGFADWLSELVKNTLANQDKFSIAISGNDTPSALYKILSSRYIDKIDWGRIHIFWADESLVSKADEKNNGRTAVKMLIENVPIPKENIHSIETDVAPLQAASQYSNQLQKFFADSETTFDLFVLGMGEQGNVLSMYPGNEENNEKEAWVIPVFDKQEDVFKITLTFPVINASAVKAFIVTGKVKEDIVQMVLKGKYDPEKYPAQLIQTSGKSVHWFLDEGAAGKLTKSIS
jgi:6-phosphogluconolactonase